jgi:hypothetical protein
MRKIILAFVVGILFVVANAFAADGDLAVNGYLGVGTATPANQVYVVMSGATAGRGIVSALHFDGTGAALLQFKRSRGTEAVPLALQSGDNIANISVFGHDGSSYWAPASIIFSVSGSVSSGTIPVDMLFYTGSTTANKAERIRITSEGNVGIGTTAPQAKLDVAGGIRMGNDTRACTSTIAGLMRYNSGNLELCNGSAWSGIQSFSCVPALSGAVRFVSGCFEYCTGSTWTKTTPGCGEGG